MVQSTKISINETIKYVLHHHQIPPNLQHYVFSKLGYFNTPITLPQDPINLSSNLIDHLEEIEYEIHNILRANGVSFLEDMLFEHLQENPGSAIHVLESNHFNQNQVTSAINTIKSYLVRELSYEKLIKTDNVYHGSDPVHEGLFDLHHNPRHKKNHHAKNSTDNEEDGGNESSDHL